VNGELSEPS